MPLRFYFRWLMSLLLAAGSLEAAHATHITGGDIAYSSVTSTTAGVPRYHVTVRLFRDANSVVFDSHVLLNASRNGCNAVGADNIQVTVFRGQPSQPYPLSCTSNPGYSIPYEVSLYETDLDLPAGQWTLGVTIGNRAADIVNITNSINTSFFLSAFLDNTLTSQDASPRFLSTLLPHLNGNVAQTYTLSAFDSDGDSLVYTMVYPQQDLSYLAQCGTTVLNYSPPPNIQLNPALGALTVPAGVVRAGRYVLATRVTEYRRLAGTWQPIGWIMRDMTYLATNTANQPPHFTSLAVGSSPSQALDKVVVVRPGQAVSLTLTATDPDAGQALRFSSESPTIIPGLLVQTVGATQAQLTWQVPTNLPPGRYTASIAAFDNGCPINGSVEQTIAFLVAPLALATHPAASATVEAFPVPFHNQVQFQVAAGGQAVTVVDALGRLVAQLSSQPDGRVVWQPAATLPAGLYIARSADGHLLARLLRAAD